MEETNDVMEDGSTFASVYTLKLLFETKVELNRGLLYRKLREAFHEIDIVSEESLSMIALKKYMVTYKDEEQMPSMLMYSEPRPFDQDSIPEMALMFCHRNQQEEPYFTECKYELLLGDFMAGGLDYKERCQILAKYVDVFLDLYPECIALYWPQAQKLMPTHDYQMTAWKDSSLHFLDGGVNVRYFHIKDSEDMLVDTIGLTAIGLPDLQVHFHTLDMDFIIAYVHQLAAYLFTHGDIIQPGDTIDGRTNLEKWHCYYEDSLIAPNRMVLDIDTNEYAAGTREHHQKS